MKLSDLIKACGKTVSPVPGLNGGYDPAILSITADSRDVKPGSLFIALKGQLVDGHDYIDSALENGAAAVIAQTHQGNDSRIIRITNTRAATAAMAARFYGNPSKEMTLLGVTGTNGKTTITWLMESIFKSCGFSTGVIGTVNTRYNHETFDTPGTTPDAIDLQKSLYEMKNAGVTHVVMEVSSHGLDLNRVDCSEFDAGIFTNLTQDHLDYHKDMTRYFNSKRRFFTQFLGPNGKNNAPAILNIDDPKGRTLQDSLEYKTIGVSTKKPTDVYARNIRDDIQGLSCTITLPDGSFNIKSRLTGLFNLENILCAAGAAHVLNISPELIKQGIENCRTIPGRLEKITNPIDRFMFVDYAHTPDALRSILQALQQRAPKRVITVFGCGGDRDREKRSVMGNIACTHSDIAIATSDNPRTENPDTIIRDILEGMTQFSLLSPTDLIEAPLKKGYLVEVDRQKALEKAVFLSKPGDIIVAAGKGHETYQITNAGTIHFDDREELEKAALKLEKKFNPIAWSIDDLGNALETTPFSATKERNLSFKGISTDSRSIHTKDIFLALKGENFDGHTYINKLVDQGIKGFVVEKSFIKTLDEPAKAFFKEKGLVIFETENTLTALGQLARYQRCRSNVRMVAITGSSGKTTTRKIMGEIFNTRYLTHTTRGNLNNEIGLPMTLLKLSMAHEWAVIEMGMNHRGEISRLSRIALPDIAMVINTAGVHLEGLGSVENVARAKAEIFEGVRENGTAIIFADDPRSKILETMAQKNPGITDILFFGGKKEYDLSAGTPTYSGNTTRFTTRSDHGEETYRISSPARFMVNNCLAAILAATTAGIKTDVIKMGILAFTPVSGRMDIQTISDTITLMDDTYNANPDSVSKALETLANIKGDKKSIAVLGDMLELGEQSRMLHRQIGQKAALSGISKLFLHGNNGEQTARGAIEKGFPAKDIFCGTKERIARKIMENVQTKTIVLVKGSRGMAMETVIKTLQQLIKLNSLKEGS